MTNTKTTAAKGAALFFKEINHAQRHALSPKHNQMELSQEIQSDAVKKLLEELQLKIISLSVVSQEFDSDEDHEAVSAYLNILMNWVKSKKETQ